jgi:hypothetical protein
MSFGSINPIPDDQPDTPAHWSVTFAVDDADATAAKGAELGGKVIVPPFDPPWVRMTVIGDPQGATFIASKFVPENKDLGSQPGPDRPGRGSARGDPPHDGRPSWFARLAGATATPGEMPAHRPLREPSSGR